ncbi:MBL fold metallo-hydrolase [Nocardiopsis rhodophaea]|uniref:MBL fold metallo-hydrolase n=1 Tax=Nocardiopsis rhodophaea TaxID=280238 RepID=A0ABN2T860_9ACTN
MRQIQPDLWETEPEFPAPGLSTHAYLWTASSRNVLFYNTTLEQEIDAMAELGGVARQYLSHQDEIAPSLRTIKERFGSTLHCGAAEEDVVAESCPVDAVFEERRVELDGFEVLPTPGHTPGSACFLVPSVHGLTYLFTGDTILRHADGTWFAGHIPGYSDRGALATSLSGLAHLTPDIVISSGFAGDTGVTELGERAWADCVEEALRSLTET